MDSPWGRKESDMTEPFSLSHSHLAKEKKNKQVSTLKYTEAILKTSIENLHQWTFISLINLHNNPNTDD